MIVYFITLWFCIYGLIERSSIGLYKNSIIKRIPRESQYLNLLHNLYLISTGVLAIYDIVSWKNSIGYLICYTIVYFGVYSIYFDETINPPLLALLNSLVVIDNNISYIIISFNKLILLSNLFKVQRYLFSR